MYSAASSTRSQRSAAVSTCGVQVTVRIRLIPEGPASQSQHPPHVSGRERDLKAIGRGIGEALHGVGPRIVVLALLTVGDDGRSRGFELLDGVPNCPERLRRTAAPTLMLRRRRPPRPQSTGGAEEYCRSVRSGWCPWLVRYRRQCWRAAMIMAKHRAGANEPAHSRRLDGRASSRIHRVRGSHRPRGCYGRWLRSHKVVVKIEKTAFMHASLAIDLTGGSTT